MSDAAYDLVLSALIDPKTIDVWPSDAAEVAGAGWNDYFRELLRERANGGVSRLALVSALERLKRYTDASAVADMDLTGEALSATAVRAAWKTIRGVHVVDPEKAKRSSVVAHDSGDLMSARRLVEYARGTFLYAHGGPWHHWDGRRWNRDAGAAIHELAAKVARSWWKDAAEATTREAQDALVKHAHSAQKSGAIEAAISLAAKCYPDLKIDPKRFDLQDWLLVVENGTIDLRTGELGPHDPTHLNTRLAPVAFDPGALAPRWERFLAEVLPSAEVRAYVQRAAGLSLSGVIRDHLFFMTVGAGRNGKGVLMRTLAHVLGDYAAVAPMDLLIAKSGADHPAELAILEGARFVVASELPKGKWNEPRLKQLTGGDTVPARGMRENYRNMRPTWKLWIATNERPRATGQGDSLWERLKEIRFPVQFRDEDDARPETQVWPVKDATLEAALLTELPGVLAWAVRGAVMWAEKGLGEPPEVRAATAEYRVTEDVLGPFIAERPVVQPVKLKELFAAWCEYAKGVNERPGQLRDLATALRAKGYEVRKGHANVTHVYPIDVQLQMPVSIEDAKTARLPRLPTDPPFSGDRPTTTFPNPSYGNGGVDGNHGNPPE
jgi:putative DNA primase/helicase